jgi:hypothetical protein
MMGHFPSSYYCLEQSQHYHLMDLPLVLSVNCGHLAILPSSKQLPIFAENSKKPAQFATQLFIVLQILVGFGAALVILSSTNNFLVLSFWGVDD